MRIAGTIVGIVLVLLGGIWTLQGANILKGSAVMSGQSQWMYIGLVVLVLGIAALWWTYRRRT
jgi:p-aminobenzoyl-glutamate transporter AbgT